MTVPDKETLDRSLADTNMVWSALYAKLGFTVKVIGDDVGNVNEVV